MRARPVALVFVDIKDTAHAELYVVGQPVVFLCSIFEVLNLIKNQISTAIVSTLLLLELQPHAPSEQP